MRYEAQDGPLWSDRLLRQELHEWPRCYWLPRSNIIGAKEPVVSDT